MGHGRWTDIDTWFRVQYVSKAKSGEADAVVKIVESPDFSANRHKYSAKQGDAPHCIICGRPIRALKRASWVHVIEGGGYAAEPGDEIRPRADCGCHPVGPDCRKAHPELPYLPAEVGALFAGAMEG